MTAAPTPDGLRIYRGGQDITPATRESYVDELLRALEAEGKRIPEARVRKIAAEYEQASARLYVRVMAALAAASWACEIAIARGAFCERPGTAERDGRRVCRKHARAREVRWEA